MKCCASWYLGISSRIQHSMTSIHILCKSRHSRITKTKKKEDCLVSMLLHEFYENCYRPCDHILSHISNTMPERNYSVTHSRNTVEHSLNSFCVQSRYAQLLNRKFCFLFSNCPTIVYIWFKLCIFTALGSFYYILLFFVVPSERDDGF